VNIERLQNLEQRLNKLELENHKIKLEIASLKLDINLKITQGSQGQLDLLNRVIQLELIATTYY
jgi:hypothetical protein